MSKLSDKLAGFFGRLFPMSRNKTIKLNNEIRQTESEHFAQLCEMLGFLENSLNTCTDICRDNAEQIKLCRQSLRTLEDNQVKFGEYRIKTQEIKLDIENLKKQNERISEKLSNEISEKSAGISGELNGCISHHTREILGCMTDSDKRSSDSDKQIVELIENGISENNKHAGEIRAFNSSLSVDIKSLSDSVTAGFDKTSKTGEYADTLNGLSTDNESISADIKSLSDSVTAGFDKTSKTGEYAQSLLDAENTANTIRREMNLFKRQSYLRKLYFHPGEREALAKLFSDAMNREDSAQRFSALISGLDNESRNTVSDIIHRMGMIADGNKSLQDVYTQREQEEFVRMNDEFSSKIVKLNDNLYYYNGYYLPVNQFDSSVFFTRYGIDKLTTLDSVRNKHIIDAGGYVGDTALLFSSYTDKNIHVFEASPSNMDIIRETIRLNHLDNIVPVSKALGEKSGTATFSLGERNSCNSLVERPGYNYPDHIEVPVVTLDDYVRENDLEVGLIKVDIEGGEQLLLRGAVETIRTQHPILLISIYHSANDFFEIKPMIEKMCGKYTFRIVKPANPAIALETILLAEVRDESGENIINS
ncbi:MAG: FkbM family methyltransferase [[Eubacterium] siraeum]